jgi:hypothetical protein
VLDQELQCVPTLDEGVECQAEVVFHVMVMVLNEAQRQFERPIEKALTKKEWIHDRVREWNGEDI